jgi:2-polyprenyl-3-methyl-5-hydroxy-6-metoxy-1,4-benzoquinol methylase
MTRLLNDKVDWIVPKVRGKKVLDLGCVRHSLEETKKTGWLHSLIVNEAREVLGVDYLQSEIESLSQSGYNVICANVETMELPDRYEVIVAGDLIEHLSNFGLFIAQVSKHMTENGVFLVTTPNPINFLRFMQLLVSGNLGANNEHTCWFTEKTLLQLAERYGLKKTEVTYINDSSQYYLKAKWRPFVFINDLVCSFRHQFAETLCVEFVKKQNLDLSQTN